MSNLANRQGLQPVGPFGVSMVEILVLVAAMVLFLVILVFVATTSRCGGDPGRPLRNDILAIRLALEGYRQEFRAYPPSTGFVALDGTTTPFATGEIAEADALFRYLGSATRDPISGRTIGPFLPTGYGCVVSVDLPSGVVRILVDSRRNPLRYDSLVDPDGRIEARVWSLGPDGKEGPVPFSRVQTVTDPRDEDNIASWPLTRK